MGTRTRPRRLLRLEFLRFQDEDSIGYDVMGAVLCLLAVLAMVVVGVRVVVGLLGWA